MIQLPKQSALTTNLALIALQPYSYSGRPGEWAPRLHFLPHTFAARRNADDESTRYCPAGRRVGRVARRGDRASPDRGATGAPGGGRAVAGSPPLDPGSRPKGGRLQAPRRDRQRVESERGRPLTAGPRRWRGTDF